MEESIRRRVFRLTGGLALAQAGLVAFAVVAWVIWPHVFADHDALMVLEGLQRNPVAYVMKLDPIVLVGTLAQLPVFVGLWVALSRDAPIASALGLVSGAVSTAAVLTTRPIVDLYALARIEATATAERQAAVVAAAEGLLAQFHGTAWAISIGCGGLAGILFALAMRHSPHFRTVTVWTTGLSGVGALLIVIPYVGLLSLFLLGTLVGMWASVSYGIDLRRMGRPVG